MVPFSCVVSVLDTVSSCCVVSVLDSKPSDGSSPYTGSSPAFFMIPASKSGISFGSVCSFISPVDICQPERFAVPAAFTVPLIYSSDIPALMFLPAYTSPVMLLFHPYMQKSSILLPEYMVYGKSVPSFFSRAGTYMLLDTTFSYPSFVVSLTLYWYTFAS